MDECNKQGRYHGYCLQHCKGKEGVVNCDRYDCLNPVASLGLCYKHYIECATGGCSKVAIYSGFCGDCAPDFKFCLLKNCNKSAAGGAFCKVHNSYKLCEEENCISQAIIGTVCKKHSNIKCQVIKCLNKAYSNKGFCRKHKNY